MLHYFSGLWFLLSFLFSSVLFCGDDGVGGGGGGVGVGGGSIVARQLKPVMSLQCLQLLFAADMFGTTRPHRRRGKRAPSCSLPPP